MMANGFLNNTFFVGTPNEKECNILPTIQELLASEIWRTISGAKRKIVHETKEFHIATSSVESRPNCATLPLFMMQGKGNALFITNGDLHTSNKIRACCKFLIFVKYTCEKS
ncbi:MAG: hypothetical protein H0T62_01240 [Parachlamydiaceae bacterium]|nr:hypothetical protein [Parachlamydiaceae bacterium]